MWWFSCVLKHLLPNSVSESSYSCCCITAGPAKCGVVLSDEQKRSKYLGYGKGKQPSAGLEGQTWKVNMERGWVASAQ